MVAAMSIVAICLALVLGLIVGAIRGDKSITTSDCRPKGQKTAADSR